MEDRVSHASPTPISGTLTYSHYSMVAQERSTAGERRDRVWILRPALLRNFCLPQTRPPATSVCGLPFLVSN